MNEFEIVRKPPRLALTVLAAIHLTVVLWHGATHSQLAVTLSRFQTLFVLVVIVIAPVLATLLLWMRLDGLALWIYSISMLASLLFGVYYHYLAFSPDNVHYRPPSGDTARQQFAISAAAVAITELIATVWSGFRLS